MKKLLLAALIGLSLLSVSGQALATESVKGKIAFFVSRVDAMNFQGVQGTLGVYFSLDRTAGYLGPCNRFFVGKSAPNFNTIMSLLLTAYVSKTPIEISSEYRPDFHPTAKDFCELLDVTM